MSFFDATRRGLNDSMVQTPPATSLDFVQEAREEIDAALARALELDAGCPERLRRAMEHSLLAPCKRLRPLLVLMAAEACGGDVRSAMPAACAIEMVHTYSLIHDDLPAMDDDGLRRGRPTCHKQFDEATAVLAGDGLLALAFDVLAHGVQPPETAARCCAELARAAGPAALVGGQADDLAAQTEGGDIDRLESIHRRKTGALFLASLRLGAIVAGADGEQLEALNAYGEKLGLAFQIVDDLLDRQGDAATLGKRTQKDADRGKLTFPGLLGVPESRRRAQRLIDEACRALSVLGESANRLEQLAQYVLERNH